MPPKTSESEEKSVGSSAHDCVLGDFTPIEDHDWSWYTKEMPNLQLDYKAVEEEIKAGYRAATEQYRRDDEVEVRTENHQRLASIITQTCQEFAYPIRVLDVGCGTGRFFHAVKNAAQLKGIDITDEMLSAARQPVLQDEVSVADIELIRCNVYLTQFPRESFDFIYSLGMFGHGCPVTSTICEALYSWLRPGGRLFFNTVDFAGLPRSHRVRRRIRNGVYRLVPGRLKAKLDERELRCPFFPVTSRQLRQILLKTSIRNFRISSHACKSPLWSGRHLECQVVKSA